MGKSRYRPLPPQFEQVQSADYWLDQMTPPVRTGPARGMRISQAKIKICSHTQKKKKTLSINFPNTLNTPLSACRMGDFQVHRDGPPWSRSGPTLTPQPPEANTGRDGKTRSRSWALVQNTHSVNRADKRRQKLPNQNKPSLHTTNSNFLQ